MPDKQSAEPMTPEQIAEYIVEEADKTSSRRFGAHTEANLVCFIAELIHAQRAEAAREAVEWQPIETAPRDGTLINVFKREADLANPSYLPNETPPNKRFCAFFSKSDAEWFCSSIWNGSTRVMSNEFFSKEFSHWMPLPQPPEGGGE